MIQSLAKIGWVGLLSISLCLQMAWASPFRTCECAQPFTQSGSLSCAACVSKGTSKSGAVRFAASTSPRCCCSRSGLLTAAGAEPDSSTSQTNSWTHPDCDCGWHASLPASPGVVSKLILSPRGPQPSMMPSAARWQGDCLSESIRLLSTRSIGPPRHFSQTLLCVWLI